VYLFLCYVSFNIPAMHGYRTYQIPYSSNHNTAVRNQILILTHLGTAPTRNLTLVSIFHGSIALGIPLSLFLQLPRVTVMRSIWAIECISSQKSLNLEMSTEWMEGHQSLSCWHEQYKITPHHPSHLHATAI